MSVVLEARDLRKTYRGGDGRPIEVLAGVNLDVRRGEFVAIVGESGSGKSTLLHLLGGLDDPTDGTVALQGQEYRTMPAAERAWLRNQAVGFVFQFHHLLRDFTAFENVMIPMQIAGMPAAEARARAEELLAGVGLSARLEHRPNSLSGGEQQRVAVARALATRPAVVLADEPSGNLDRPTAERLHALLGSLAADYETALVVVTHNPALAALADRILAVRDGVLSEVPGVEALP
jgi:lipoprotein-releasing system ATP-binding protein